MHASGRWWYDEHEIDAVGLDDETRTIVLGECKWRADPVDCDVLAGLEEVAPEVRWQGTSRREVFALFSRAGFSDTLREEVVDQDDVLLFAPDDVVDLFE